MKIVIFITGLGMGGAENLVINLANKYTLLGHDVTIIYAMKNQVLFPNDRVQVISLGVSSYADFPLALWKFINIVNSIKPDVIHSHMYHANILSRLAKPFVSTKRLINTAHSTNEGGSLRMLIYRLTDFFADVTTNVSKEAVEVFIDKKAASSKKIIPIENGIDTEYFVFSQCKRNEIRRQLKVKEKDVVILSVGSLRDAKDYPNLLYAISDIVKFHKKISVNIIGDGPDFGELLSLTNELGIQSYVNFLGNKKNIPDYLSACDIFVLPSKYEGFGLVVAEAMACQRLVIGTDCGGVKEVMGSIGYLIEKQNPKELRNTILMALEMSESERNKVGFNARNRIIEKYSLDFTVSKYLKIYKNR